MLHCTYERPNSRYHKVYIDYQEIAGFDVGNGIGIRFFGQKTDERIGWLRVQYGIPEDQLPPDVWLWLDESVAAPAMMAYYACGVRGRTTLARTIRDRNPDHLPPSLIQLGYVKTRYIARRSRFATPARVYTELHHDHEGKAFIIVEDYQGYYLDTEGELHCSIEEGYSEVVKQYLFCFEVVNAAIAQIDDSTPPALPRYDPKQKMVSQEQQEAHRNNGSASSDTNKTNTTTYATISGGNRQSATHVEASTCEDITCVGGMSIRGNSEATNGQGQSLRRAPWTAETLIALASAVLPVPGSAACHAALWEKEWQRPATLLLAATETLSPPLAWERIDLVVRWMTDETSPSWWRTGRTKQTPTTLRHVQAHFTQYYDAYKKSDWHPAETTPYDGPPMEYYQQGYTGTPTPPETAEAASPAEYVPIFGMLHKVARRLCSEIYQEYPQLALTLASIENSDRVQVGFEYAQGAWLDLPSFRAWRNPSPETLHYLDQALHFAAERNALPTEVGVVEVAEEPPLIVLEAAPDDAPPADVEETYVSMEEINEDLQRGLRPLSSSPAVEAVPVVAKSPPTPALQGKAGMSLMIAGLLLESIVSEGYQAELRPISDDRAVLSVEASPGTWIEIDSGVAWAKHVKSVAQSPPGSLIGALEAVGGTVITMEVAQ